MQDMNDAITRIEAELAEQDARWREAQEQLLALGDVELSIDQDLVSELEAAAQPKLAGTVPVGLIRM